MKSLNDFERYVIEEKGTERPFSGKYNDHNAKGRYICRKCGNPLYLSEHKFVAHCGWPAFDDEIKGAVTRIPDADGRRTEIVCSQCQGHLGHVFEGEYLTSNNLRHCVNSVSLDFEPIEESSENMKTNFELATLGGGCFWCSEAIFLSLDGVNSVTSGYAGGDENTATYKQVCGGGTGHAEVVQIEFDPNIITYSELLEVFFASHDPTTLNRQGNDVGTQYRSVIFAHTDTQIIAATEMIKLLDNENVFANPIVTELTAFDTFYPAEDYHNDYFALHGEQPYCSIVIKPKVDKIRGRFAHKLKAELK